MTLYVWISSSIDITNTLSVLIDHLPALETTGTSEIGRINLNALHAVKKRS